MLVFITLVIALGAIYDWTARGLRPFDRGPK